MPIPDGSSPLGITSSSLAALGWAVSSPALEAALQRAASVATPELTDLEHPPEKPSDPTPDESAYDSDVTVLSASSAAAGGTGSRSAVTQAGCDNILPVQTGLPQPSQRPQDSAAEPTILASVTPSAAYQTPDRFPLVVPPPLGPNKPLPTQLLQLPALRSAAAHPDSTPAATTGNFPGHLPDPITTPQPVSGPIWLTGAVARLLQSSEICGRQTEQPLVGRKVAFALLEDLTVPGNDSEHSALTGLHIGRCAMHAVIRGAMEVMEVAVIYTTR